MKKILLTIMMVALVIASASCKKDPVEKGPTKLSIVTDDLVTVPYAGQEGVVVEFICDGEWEAKIASEIEGWLAFVGDNSGKGNGKLTIDVLANGEKTERTATVEVAAGSLKASVQIKQDGKKLEITFKHPSIAFTDEQFAKIKAAWAVGAPSLKGAVDLILTRAAGAYDPETITTDQKQEKEDMELLYKTMKGPAVLTLNKSFGAKITDDEAKKDAWVEHAIQILCSWASACKDVEYPINDKSITGAGMYLARAAWPFFVTYDCWKGTKYISAGQDALIVAWFRNIEKAIKASMNAWENNDYFGKQYWQNQLAAHMWGLLTIGYILEDSSLVQYAIDSDENPRDFYELIEGMIFMAGDTPCEREAAGSVAPQTGEIYDRYRHDTEPLKGLQYASLSLQVLSSAARTCYNNGIDMYAYTAPTGENLRLCYEFYAPFYEKIDASLQGGYYTGETDRVTKAGDMQGLFELGLNAYPDSEPIQKVINAIPNRFQNKVQMHDQLGYTRLYSIDADATK